MINRAKLQHILEYAEQQRHIGLHCKVPPEDMVEIVEMAMLQSAERVSNRDELPNGWVACSERMPKKGQEVLCTDRFENYETALYDTGYIPGPPFFATTAGEFHPTHWMPLPAAPKQEVKP